MNPSTAAATVIVDELIRNGVTHFVLSPGSRNAPLSVAIFAAAKSGRATLHVRIDERSAGFLALGLSKGMGYGPRRGGRAAIVCTSGTAVANLHPAVLEAVHSGEPLVLLTADRPAELVGSGANQTTVQSGVFGPQVSTVDFPIAERRAGQNATWRGILCRVLIDGADKPVHLNVPFREPLLPDSDVAGKPDLDAAGDAAEGADALRDWPESLAGREGGVPWTRWRQTLATDTAGGAATDAGGDSGGVELLRELPARTLVIVGDAPWSAASAAGEVARRMDWPLLVEPPGVGPRHALSGASLMINAVTELPDGLKPDAVLVVGRPTLSRGTGRLLRSVSRVHLVCTPRHWADAQYVASSAVPYLGVAAVHHLAADGAIDEHTDAQWTASWRKANASVADAVRCWLADQPWPTGATVARDLLAALPSRAVLFMGSSNAIRDIDLVAERRGDLIVLANRGLAGIDGAVSTAIGATLGAGHGAMGAGRGGLTDTGLPGYAYLGDLSFLHDVGGLLLAPDEPRPDLTVVVNNDDGGGIFELLEQGAPEHRASFERVFGTPHGVDLGALCAGYGVPHTLADSADAFADAVRPGPGLRVVEVRTDRSSLRAARAELYAAVEALLS